MKIVLVVLDALRRDHLACYGNTWLKCGNLARLADRAMMFTNAHAAKCDCQSVRAELLTGISAARIDKPMTLVDSLSRHNTLTGLLKTNGFTTGLMTDHRDVLPIYRSCGMLDFVRFVPGQGDDTHISSTDELRAIANAETSTAYEANLARREVTGHPTMSLFQQAAHAVDELSSRDDYLLIIDSFALMPPWDAPIEHAVYRKPQQVNTQAWPKSALTAANEFSADELKLLRCAYADNCMFVDHALAPLIDAVGRQDDVYIICVSDHGVLIGDDDYVGWDSSLRSDAIADQVMFVAGPAVSQGTCDRPAGACDIFSGILALADVTPPFRPDGEALIT